MRVFGITTLVAGLVLVGYGASASETFWLGNPCDWDASFSKYREASRRYVYSTMPSAVIYGRVNADGAAKAIKAYASWERRRYGSIWAAEAIRAFGWCLVGTVLCLFLLKKCRNALGSGGRGPDPAVVGRWQRAWPFFAWATAGVGAGILLIAQLGALVSLAALYSGFVPSYERAAAALGGPDADAEASINLLLSQYEDEVRISRIFLPDLAGVKARLEKGKSGAGPEENPLLTVLAGYGESVKEPATMRYVVRKDRRLRALLQPGAAALRQGRELLLTVYDTQAAWQSVERLVGRAWPIGGPLFLAGLVLAGVLRGIGAVRADTRAAGPRERLDSTSEEVVPVAPGDQEEIKQGSGQSVC